MVAIARISASEVVTKERRRKRRSFVQGSTPPGLGELGRGSPARQLTILLRLLNPSNLKNPFCINRISTYIYAVKCYFPGKKNKTFSVDGST